MAAPVWNPPIETTVEEEQILKRLKRVRKLFAFLRLHRHLLFDEEFQQKLCGVYRSSGAGRQPKAPGQMAMVVLLQAYMQISDAEAVELTVMDLRWQLALDCLGATAPLCSQGTLQQFRMRMIDHGLDEVLFAKTIEVAEATGAFDPKKLLSLRLAVDSAPFEGAGRVEDTFNLLAHAARNLIGSTLFFSGLSVPQLATKLGLELVTGTSVKAALDINWSDKAQARDALVRLVREVGVIVAYARNEGFDKLGEEVRRWLETIEQIEDQNLDGDDESVVVRRGVAKDRRISVEDEEMRHGRKSRSRRINGYKRHLGMELDSRLIVYCAVTQANQQDADVMEDLREAMESGGWLIDELHVDRGYLSAALVDELYAEDTEIVCKPWTANSRGKYTKAQFDFDIDAETVTCPSGTTVSYAGRSKASFPAPTCDSCELRTACTDARLGRGRTVSVADNERMHNELRQRLKTSAGRARLRERVHIEHAQAHLVQRQGATARYVGQRKNLFDVRRCAAIQNLETIHRHTRSQGRHDMRMAA